MPQFLSIFLEICPFAQLSFLPFKEKKKICIQFILCNWTYVWNKVGICVCVSQGRCVSSQRPMPTWPTPLIKKPLLALVSLSTKPSPLLCGSPECVCACWSEGTCGLDRRHREGGGVCSRLLLLHTHVLDGKNAEMLEGAAPFLSIKSLPGTHQVVGSARMKLLH